MFAQSAWVPYPCLWRHHAKNIHMIIIGSIHVVLEVFCGIKGIHG